VRVLVTGADGFVGRYLLRRLLADGHDVVGARRAGVAAPEAWFTPEERAVLDWTELEIGDDASVRAALVRPVDAVIHLAAVASGREAREDPGRAWAVNAAGTARLAEELAHARDAHGGDPLLLAVSTGEVYGGADTPRAHAEGDPPDPRSPYAASKVGAEIAAREVARRLGLRLVIARPFAHTGPGQTALYVAPAFAHRLRAARRSGARTVRTGNLEPVRDILDVRDVVEAYVALLERGASGSVYNVARGEGVSLRELFGTLARLVGVEAEPVVDPALARTSDIPYLVGDAARLRAATGWSPAIPLERTLRDLIDAQAD
jgi:GDP-4-dehydro-6-deoxy-D-mannose reductase